MNMYLLSIYQRDGSVRPVAVFDAAMERSENAAERELLRRQRDAVTAG